MPVRLVSRGLMRQTPLEDGFRTKLIAAFWYVIRLSRISMA